MQSRIIMESKMETKNITITLPAYVLPVESRGTIVECDLARIPHDIFLQLIPHAIKQKVADAAANAPRTIWNEVKGKDAPAPSRDQLKDFSESHADAIATEITAQMSKVVDALYEGKWMVREGNGTSTKWSDQQALALDMAKDTLKGVFKAAADKAGVANKIAEWIKLSDKIAAFFNTGGKVVSWNDRAVMAWIAAQAAKDGGADYMEQAVAELARRAEVAETVDMNDILGDL